MVLRDDISKWFDEGVKTGAKWMIILFDELDQRERAVYAASESEARSCESLPRESETILEVYDLSLPKEPQVECLRANGLERIDNASHDTAVFRTGQAVLGSPLITSKKVVKKKAPPPPSTEDEGNREPLAIDYAFESFPLYRIKEKWHSQVEQYLNEASFSSSSSSPPPPPPPPSSSSSSSFSSVPSSSSSSVAGLHGALVGLRSLYGLGGEKWSYAREKAEVGLIKGTSDCGNSSVSMGFASLHFRDRDEGVMAIINLAQTLRFQIYVKSQGTVLCLLDQRVATKGSLNNLKVGNFVPRKEESIPTIATEFKQCFTNPPWQNPKLLLKLSKQANLPRDVSTEPVTLFAFVTGELRNYWEKLEDVKEAEEIALTVKGIVESLLPSLATPGKANSFLIRSLEEGQMELEGVRCMYQQFSLATGHALEPVVCFSVGRKNCMWTMLSVDDPSVRNATQVELPFGTDDEDFGPKLSAALTNAYQDQTDMLGALVDSVTRRGNLPVIALKSGCLQSLEDVYQDDKLVVSGKERRRLLVEKIGALYCPQQHPLVDTPATEHICTYCDHPALQGQIMRSCRVCDYDCCSDCRPRTVDGALKLPLQVFLRRLSNPKWKAFELKSLSIPELCYAASAVLTEPSDSVPPQFVKIRMFGQNLNELSGVVAGSVLTCMTGAECRAMKEEPPPLTRAVPMVVQASTMPAGLSTANLSGVQWREFIAYAQWQLNHGTRKWGESEHTSCLYALAWCYLKGKFVKQNKAESHRLFVQAANQGNPNGLYFVGSYFMGGANFDSERGAKGYRLLDLAAELGVLEARFQLGRCLDEGIGVAKNEKESLANYRLAADQGHAVAQRMMGVAYLNGKGVAQDTKEATRWLHLAAGQEDHAAHNILLTISGTRSSTFRVTEDKDSAKKDPVRSSDNSGRGMLSRESSLKRLDDPKPRVDDKLKDDSSKGGRMELPKKPEAKKEEPKSPKAADSFKRVIVAAIMDKPKERLEREQSIGSKPAAKQHCLVSGCREDHKKHFCKFCKNDNSTHFSSVCPKKPK